MLDSVDEITAPHPPHILQRFIPLLPLYGDLHEADNFRQLAEDVCALVNCNPVVWDGIRIDAAEVLAACRQQSLYELFRVIYDSAARQAGAKFWLCKSMKNVFYADGIESTGLHPIYIYLYRDGRDVACSFRKAIVGEKHVYAIARNWRNDQEAALALRDRVPADRFIAVSYEALTAEPEQTVRRICDFIGIAYADKMMDFYKSSESAHTATAGKMWANLTRPVMKHNTNKFLRELSAEDIAVFESVAGDVLTRLGYELHTPAPLLRSSFSPEEIEAFAQENARLKAEFLRTVDPADLQKRRAQDDLLRAIKERAMAV
jgi:hypothetical protein